MSDFQPRPGQQEVLDYAGGKLDAFEDEQLAQYYRHLDRIIRGPLCSPGRWVDIVKMNLGV